MSGNTLPKHGYGVRLHRHRVKGSKPHPPMYTLKDLAERYGVTLVTLCDAMVTAETSHPFPKPAGQVFKADRMVNAWVTTDVDQWAKRHLSTEKAKLSTG